MNKSFPLVIALIALVISIFGMFNSKENTTEAIKESEKVENGEHKEIELAQYMSMLQTHFSKLYYAGSAKNLELSQFYIHEMEESFETIVNANVFEDGQNISTLANQFGLAPTERLHDIIEKEGFVDFENQYQNMILNCNSCHLKTAHSFIQITTPQNPPVGNQKFD